MKIDTSFQEDHQAKLTVEVEPERLEEMKQRAAAKIARKVKIPGFRPGKAPYPVILRTIGEAAIFEEALEMLVEKIYPEVVQESKIDPYGPGRLENVANLDPLTLEFVIPLDAEVTLSDYRSFRKPYELPTVSDEEVEQALENLRKRQAIIEPVERPAQEGDVVTTILNGVLLNDQAEEKIIDNRSIPVLIHSEDSSTEEWPFPGFSRNLIGKNAGDTGSLEYQYPDSYRNEHLQGKKAEFEFTVENVKSRTLPELSDEFASSLGEFENLDALRSQLLKNLETEAASTYHESYDDEAIEELVEQSSFKYPPQMLAEQIDQVKQDLIRRLERQGIDLDIYLKSREMDESAFLEEEVKPVAEKRLKRNLLLYEIGKIEQIQVEKEELETEANQALSYLNQVLPEKDARRLKNRDVQGNLVNNVFVDLISRKTIERLRLIASGQYSEPDVVESVPEVEAVAETNQDESPATDDLNDEATINP